MKLKHHLLNLSGILPFRRWLQRTNLLVLTAHRVSDGGENPQWQPLRPSIDPEIFFTQIDETSKYYNWVDLEQAISILSGDDLGIDNPVLLTFDDGYESNMRVLPGLTKRNIKPVFFVTTAYLNCRSPFWFDRFDYAIQQLQAPHKISVIGEEFHFESGDRRQLGKEYRRLRDRLKELDWRDEDFLRFFDEEAGKIEAVTGHALKDIQQVDEWSSTMTHEQVAQVATRGLASIGSHTIDHSRLIHLTSSECVHQLEDSKRQLEEITGVECESFCYPSGDFDDRTTELVEQAQYKLAFTTVTGLIPENSNHFALDRIHLPSYSDPVRVQATLCDLSGLRRTFNNYD